MNDSPKNRRRSIRILFPRIQGRFLTLTLAVIGTSLVVHSALAVWSLTSLVDELPNDGELIQKRIVPIVLRDLGWAFVLTAPAFALLAMTALMAVIGPLYRMRSFLQRVLEGQHPEPCKLREGDEMQDLCMLLNQVTEPMRTRSSTSEEKREVA